MVKRGQNEEDDKRRRRLARQNLEELHDALANEDGLARLLDISAEEWAEAQAEDDEEEKRREGVNALERETA